ncbi:trans-sialidase, putative [Trypanosoma cruzi marinkellei]|uniref:Trans-sialidase, putative n=1 Tax=Trypanosoma cruzi marinkellei TaxID=85056 RepID=K2MS00_TRYCR|nr:trans-sialidase, putative [Trypanosoma cruzi marinkellei]
MPLMAASLWDGEGEHAMGLSCTADNMWEAAFNGTTTESRAWEPKQEYQVSPMFHENKGFVYIDGQSLGEEEVLLTGERPHAVFGLCFGACDAQEAHVTVTNVLLYSRPLNSTEMRAVDGKVPILREGLKSQWEGVSQPIAPAGSAVLDPGETPAVPAGRAEVTFGLHAVEGVNGSGAEKRSVFITGSIPADASAVSLTTAWHGLLPPLFPLGLWGFAAL